MKAGGRGKREVEEGRWRNPGQTPEAKAINSLPHKYTGALADALEKVRIGVKSAEMSDEEREALSIHRKQKRDARKEEVNQYYKERYHARKQAMTDEQREAQRQKWREQNRKRAAKKKAASG